MKTPPLKSLVATCVVFLTLVKPSEGFFELVFGYFFSSFFSSIFSNAANRVAETVAKPVGTVVLGGGTEIVSQALTHDYIPGMRDVTWNAVTTVISAIGSLIIEAVWSIITGIIEIVPQIISAIVSGSVTLGIEIGKGVTSGLASLINVISPLLLANDGLFALTYVYPDIRVDEGSISGDASSVRLLRGRRAVPTSANDLHEAFIQVSGQEPLQCLQLVLCAIHADPDDFMTSKEVTLKNILRKLFREESSTPIWAKRYINATKLGSTMKSNHLCQEAYPSCSFSSQFLRRVINKVFEAGDYFVRW